MRCASCPHTAVGSHCKNAHLEHPALHLLSAFELINTINTGVPSWKAYMRFRFLAYCNISPAMRHLRGPFKKFMDSPYYSELELCGGAVMVSFSKYLPWQAFTSYNSPPTSQECAAHH